MGLNGSGKSNLMESISFVLGTQSSSLREKSVSSLIYRDKTGERREAWVKLVLEDTEEEDEISFTRSISGNETHYKINERNVSHAQYINQLEGMGLNVKAHNFLVPQGQISSIAHDSYKEISEIIERISGSIEQKRSYEKLLEEKEKAEENTYFNYQKKKGMTAQKKQFKAQKQEADHFQTLQAKREELTVNHILWQLYHNQRQFEEINEAKEKAKQHSFELLGEKDKIDNQLKEKKKEQSRLHKSCTTKEREIQEIKTKLKETDLIKLEEKTGLLSKRIEASRQSLQKVNEEISKHQATITSLEQSIKELEASTEEFERQALEEGGIKTLKSNEITTYYKMKEQVYSKTSSQQQQLSKLNLELKQEQETQKSLISKKKELETRNEQLNEVLAQLKDRFEKMESFYEQTEETKNELTTKFEQLRVMNEQRSKQQKHLTEQLETIQEKLREAKSVMKESERDTKFKEAIESMKRLFPGVRGRIVDLCAPVQSKYKLAVTVALGPSMEAIVVDKEKTARECIAYLRDQRIGTATFIPLSRESKPINEKLRLLGGSAVPVIDVLKFDPSDQNAILYACGNTIICDTLAEARRLSFGSKERHKVVTLDGTLIHKSGLMTGGLSGIELHAQKWDQKRIDELKQTKEKYILELAEIGRSLRSVDQEQQLNAQIKGLEGKLVATKEVLQSTKDKITAENKNKKTIEKQIKEIEQQSDEENSKIKKLEKNIESISKAIFEIEDSIFQEFCAQAKVPNIRVYETTQLKKAEELAQQRAHFAEQLSKLNNQLNYEKQRDLRTPKQRLETSIKNDTKELEKLESEKESLEEEREGIEQELNKLKLELQDLQKKLEAKDKEIKELRQKIHPLEQEILSAQKKVTACETELEKLRDKRHEVLQRATLEQIDLPKLEEEEEEEIQDPMELEDPSTQTYEREEEYVKKIDFSKVDKGPIKSSKQYDQKNEKFLSEIRQLTEEIEKLAPNLRAEQHLQDVSEKLKETTDEFDSATKQVKEIKEKFYKVKKERCDLFMHAFKHISSKIDEIYKAITGSSQSSASLILENENEPFNGGIIYSARPPQKRIMDIQQLSGGEKAVASLALLFAIQSYQPQGKSSAPFFVLDEVDAALDRQNVVNITRYIKKRTTDSQNPLQCIVISHNEVLTKAAETLVGIYKVPEENCSQVLTLDLSPFPDSALTKTT